MVLAGSECLHDFQLIGFSFQGSACFLKLTPLQKFANSVKYMENLKVLEKNFGDQIHISGDGNIHAHIFAYINI
jgi:hypothetical protein